MIFGSLEKWRSWGGAQPILEQFCSNFRFLKCIFWTLEIWILAKIVLKIEWLDAYLGNVHTFESVVKFSLILFWSARSKFFDCLNFGIKNILKLFVHNIVQALFLHTVWLKSVINFSVYLHIIQKYRSNFDHISDFYSLVIGK